MTYLSQLSSLKLLLIVTILCSVTFMVLPELDLIVANLFYEGNNNFFLRNSSIHSFIDTWVRPSLKYLVTILTALSVCSLVSKGRFINWPIRNISFVILTFALGPGLLVNGFLKEFIGRARPKHIIEFGGDKVFTPAYFPADQCAHNCSFVSGDVSFGFATIALALLFNGSGRSIAILISLLLGTSIALYRIATGAHFLSDTLLAGLFSIFIALFCHRTILNSAK